MENPIPLPPLPLAPKKSLPVSALMRTLGDRAVEEDLVPVGHILEICGVQGFAFLMLTLSLLNIVIFMVPFISILFGLPMILLAAQMVVGLETPIFPRLLRERTIRHDMLLKGIHHASHSIEKIEHYIKPRLEFLSHARLNRIHGLVALILAIMVTIPIPIFNVLPSVALALLAIGMLQHDGIFILLAYTIGFWCLALFKSLGHIAHSLTLNGTL